MLNEKSIDRINKSVLREHLRAPRYDSYSFSNISGTILSAFGIEQSTSLPNNCFPEISNTDHVVAIFLDSFGLNLFERYIDEIPTLSAFSEQSTVSKLTSVYPSTTSNALTVLLSGRCPNQNYVFDWSHFEPRNNKIVWPLPYSFYRGEWGEIDDTPEALFPCSSVFAPLKSKGVSMNAYMREKAAGGKYHNYIYRDFDINPFLSLEDGFQKLVANIKSDQRSLSLLHYIPIDSTSHIDGPYSPEARKEIETFFSGFTEGLLPSLPKNTLLLLFSDHGQSTLSEEKTHYLNELYPELRDKLVKDAIPCGSLRNFALYLEDKVSALDISKEINKKIDGIGVSFTKDELLENGVYGGGEPAKHFLERAPDITVFPFSGEAIWWGKPQAGGYLGHHGGLSPDEVDIPFFSLFCS